MRNVPITNGSIIDSDRAALPIVEKAQPGKRPIKLVHESAISAGDTVTDMHCHIANGGICADWEVLSGLPMELDEDHFFDKIDELRSLVAGSNSPVTKTLTNKMAYVLSKVVGADEMITAVLVVYIYDNRFWLSMLFAR